MIDNEIKAAAGKGAVIGAGNAISWLAVNDVLSTILTLLTIIYVIYQIIKIRRDLRTKRDAA
jgi:hypothetical protein